MTFEYCPEDFLGYQHSFESPDLRPISLPMSGHDKSLDGMINLQNAAISFPGSNVFADYVEPAYGHRVSCQFDLSGTYQEGEPDNFSDNEFGYSLEYDPKPAAQTDNYNNSENVVLINGRDAQSSSRKRKASSPGDDEPQPQKKVAVAQVHVQDPDGEYYELNSQPSPYSPYVPAHVAHTVNNSPRPSHHYSTSNASQVSIAAHSPHTPAWSPSFTTVKTEHSPRGPMTPLPRPASTTTPCSNGMPKLVRTSTMPQQTSPAIGAGMVPHGNTHNFNPYAMYPQNKASLRLKGDLDAVALDWSDEELVAQRKLIVFTRSQNGSVIDAEFKVVSQDEWSRGDISVNCIWWKEKEEAFVTSVDTIALLEQLVAVRFTVEEKNRIRRNLEGFRPLTVSKAKSDSEEFFKVIMGFPNPKPRNIEKDVKVFPWKILSPALKKIISKYSASYSSTASTLVTPVPSAYASTDNSSEYPAPSPAHHHHHHEVMPPSMPIVPMTSCDSHQIITSRASAPVTPAIPDLSLQVPSMPQAYDMAHGYGYEMVPMASYPVYPPQQPMTAPVHRMQPAWTFDGFMPDGSFQMQPASAPASAYPRAHADAADMVAPPMYRYHYQQ